VSMWGAGEGGVALVWLDGRNTGGGQGGHDGHGTGAMTLRHGIVGADGVPLVETEIDGRVCDCCQTGAALTSRGPIVVYRGRTEEEVRDVLVTRLVDGAWTAGRPVHADGWVIHGCPVNGPQVAADGERVAIAWFAAPGDSARVQLALSDDAGARFGPPVRIDDGQQLRRVDVLLLEDGDALVSWLERVEDGSAEIRVRRVAPSGAVGAAGVAARSSAARASGFPRMARGRAGVVMAWTAAGDDAGVRTARLDPAALERPR
jgi:hypothetical protein